MKLTGEQILKRFKEAESKKSNFKNTYKEAYEFFSPNRETFDNPTEGTKRSTSDGKIFDSTCQDALKKAVNNLQSSIFPPQKKFASLKLGSLLSSSAKNQDELNASLEKITDIFFQAIYTSNFDTQISEVLEDLLMGTGSMMMQKGTLNNPFVFVAIPLAEVFLERGVDGSIRSHYRRWQLEGELLQETWEDIKLTDELANKVKEKPTEKISLIECTTKAKITRNRIEIKDGKGEKITETVDGFKYYVLHGKDILVERDMVSSPWVTMRYSVSAGEVYGRGPVLDALPDGKVLNKTKEFILKNAHLAIAAPRTVVDDGSISLENIRIEPGANIPVSANPGNPNGPTISVLPSGANFNVGQLVLDDLRKSIRSIMMVDPLGEIDAPVKSATEISYRAQQTAKLLGSAYGRIQIEGVKMIINRGLHILEELGLIDNLQNYRVDGIHLGIEHLSPLAKAQSEEDINAMIRYAEVISQFYGPQMMAVMTNPTAFARTLADKMKVPLDVLPTPEQLQAVQQAAMQAQAADQTQGVPQQNPIV